MTGMIELVNEYDQGGRLTGGESTIKVAHEWFVAGFTVDDVVGWWQAGCFDAQRTKELRDAGLTPENVTAEDEDGNLLGYAYCNGDITLGYVKYCLSEDK